MASEQGESVKSKEVTEVTQPKTMASSGTDNTSSDSCISPNSNPNYDSDTKSDSTNDEPQVPFIQDLHQCKLCNQAVCDPRVLNCLHSFCLYCLKGEVVSQGDDLPCIICTVCHQTTLLPTGTAENDLKIDYGRRRYMEGRTFSPRDKLICRSCRNANPAVSRCYDCSMFLCNLCSPQHKSLNCYSGHSVLPLDEPIRRHSFVAQQECIMHGVFATVYCYKCQQTFCDECNHASENPQHRTTVIADSMSFASLITSVFIEQQKAVTFAQYYSAGKKTVEKCCQTALKELEMVRKRAIKAIDYKYDRLKLEIENYGANLMSCAESQSRPFLQQIHQLDEVGKFLKTQNTMADPWDNVMTKPLVEDRLKRIKSGDFRRMNFQFSFEPANIDDQIDMMPLGMICEREMQQTVACPTGMNHSDQSLMSNGTSQFGVNGYGSAQDPIGCNRQSSMYQNSASRALGPSPSCDTNEAKRAFDYDQQFQRRNSLDMYSAPAARIRHSSSSPMTISLPNSATMVNEPVFNFSSQQPHAVNGFGSNENHSLGLSTQNQNQSYKMWSDGVDIPSNAVGSSPQPDIFAMSDEFHAPTTQNSRNTRSATSPIMRLKMQFMSRFGEYGNADAQFTEPSGVAIDNQGRLVVADTNNNRVQIFDIHGNFICHFAPNVRMTYPNRIAISRRTGCVVITERAPTHRVQTFTKEGKHIAAFADDFLLHPRGVAIDDDDNIIVIECKVMRVTIFTMEGRVISKFNCSQNLQFPNSVAVNDKQEIFISDNREHNVKVFSYGGTLLRTIGAQGLTNYPIAVAINKEGEVVVADNHNNFNLTVFTQDGQFVSGYESKTKHAQCFDLALTNDGIAILTSKDYKVYCYPYHVISSTYAQSSF